MDLGSVVLLNLLSPWSRSVEEARMLNRSFSLSLSFLVSLFYYSFSPIIPPVGKQGK